MTDQPSTLPPPQAAMTPTEARAQAKAAKAHAKALRPWYRKKRWWLLAVIVLLVILIAATAGGGDSKGTDTPSGNSPALNSPKMSKAEFDAIQTGMTPSQVADIVGSEGEVISENNLAGYHTVMMKWDGQGSLGANANVTFQNDKVISKAQFGLG